MKESTNVEEDPTNLRRRRIGTFCLDAYACEANDGLKKWGRERLAPISTHTVSLSSRSRPHFFNPSPSTRRTRFLSFVVSLNSLGPRFHSLIPSFDPRSDPLYKPRNSSSASRIIARSVSWPVQYLNPQATWLTNMLTPSRVLQPRALAS